MFFKIDDNGVIDQPDALATYLNSLPGIGGVKNISVKAYGKDDGFAFEMIFECEYFFIRPSSHSFSESLICKDVLQSFWGMRCEYHGLKAPTSFTPKFYSERGGDLYRIAVWFTAPENTETIDVGDLVSIATQSLTTQIVMLRGAARAIADIDDVAKTTARAYTDSADLLETKRDAILRQYG